MPILVGRKFTYSIRETIPILDAELSIRVSLLHFYFVAVYESIVLVGFLDSLISIEITPSFELLETF